MRQLASRILLIAGLCLGTGFGVVCWGSPVQAKDAVAWAKAAVADIDAISAAAYPDGSARATAFLARTERTFDYDAMALAAFPQASNAPAQDRARYTRAYRVNIALGFLDLTRRHGPSTTQVLGVRQTKDGRVRIFLRSMAGKTTFDSVWFVCEHSLAVCDVEVEGKLGSTTQRRRFAEVVASNGFDGLIAALNAGELTR